MGAGLRSAALAAVLLLSQPVPAMADDFVACWISESTDPWSGRVQPITRCRIAGGNVVDYASDSSVPAVLRPAIGTDAEGECWYYTTSPTIYIIVVIYPNGDVDLVTDSPGGGPVQIVGAISRCNSEPIPALSNAAAVWEYVTEYLHAPPEPAVNPRPGEGVTGLDTYVNVPVPEDHLGQLSNAGTILDVTIEVGSVVVVWGDGTINTYPADGPPLNGYPDGAATHVYESKTSQGAISVSYRWEVAWRITGGTWQDLVVPDTTTTVAYPVSEIVSVLGP